MIIEFTGQSRAGNHAVLRWMMHDMAASGKTVIWNNWTTPELGTSRLMLPGAVEINSFEDCVPRGLSLVRDPHNYWASKLMFLRKAECMTSLRENRRLWKLYARRLLNSPESCVSFNEWFESREYRDELAGRLDFRLRDVALRDIAPESGGGSFGHNLDVMNRWRLMRNDDVEYHEFFDDDVRELASKLFPGVTNAV